MKPSEQNRLVDQNLKNWLKNGNETSLEFLRSTLHLDELNLTYFSVLARQFLAPASKTAIRLAESFNGSEKGPLAYSTAVLSSEQSSLLPVTEYSDLLARRMRFADSAQQVHLWVKKMHAGLGSSLKRDLYLSQVHGKQSVQLGAKGTDLHIHLEESANSSQKPVPLAEVQLLQLMKKTESRHLASVIFHDVVSPETEKSFEKIWQNLCPLSKKGLTYWEHVSDQPNLHHSGRTLQQFMPTVDEKNAFTLNRLAPAGHGLFGFEALWLAAHPERLPQTSDGTLIAVISNGEDLSGTPTEEILGWMKSERIPLVMVTTDKTALDVKGGQISLVIEKEKAPYVTIIEKAQAEQTGQQQLFENLGLRPEDKKAFFNTNMALINYEVMVPLMQKLIDRIGIESLIDALGPTLIQNRKKQEDSDGEVRTYTQLEGAMGSCLLNLDRVWREQFQEPLVHFLNVDQNHRTRFFAPIKTAFDFVLQFHTDRFRLDSQYNLMDLNPGQMLEVQLECPQDPDRYEELESTLTSFRGVQLCELHRLQIHGPVRLEGVCLKGYVTIWNGSDEELQAEILREFDPSLVRSDGVVVLENKKVIWKNGRGLQIESLTLKP